MVGEEIVCKRSGQTYPIEEGIPRLYWPHESISAATDVTELVKAFYEETPFPNYDDHDSVRSLIEKSRRGQYARVLDESIPYNSRVLEVGCGEGRLTWQYADEPRSVTAIDLDHDALRVARVDCPADLVDRVHLICADSVYLPFAKEKFDIAILAWSL